MKKVKVITPIIILVGIIFSIFSTVSANAATCKVSFNVNASTAECSKNSKTVTYGKSYGTLPTPTRRGYSFKGWFTNKTDGTKITSSSTVTKKNNHTLYAHWAAKTYTVTFDATGGICNTKEKKVTFDSSYGSLPNPTKKGYTFAGWFTSKTDGTKVKANTIVNKGNHTLYAHWNVNEYTVTFDCNGGNASSYGVSITDPITKKVTYDSIYGIFDFSVGKKGYTFLGWFTEKTGGTKITAKSIVQTAQDHTLYAHWQVNKYSVTFNLNDGTPQESMYDKTVTYDQPYGYLPNEVTRVGYTLDGWFTDKTGGEEITEDTIVQTAKNHTLYAQWTANEYTVTFNAGDGECDTESIDVTFDDTYYDLPTAYKEGLIFKGWFTEDNMLITKDTVVTIPNNHTLYAKYGYAVQLNANGGVCDKNEIVLEEGDTFTNLPAPVKNGYIFVGWYSTPMFTQQITSDTVYSNGNITSIYARYLQKKATGVKVKLTSYSSVELSWDRQADVSGYMIYVKSGKQGYKLHSTINNPNATSEKITKLSTHKKYKFKVKSFIKTDNKEYISNYSSAVQRIETFVQRPVVHYQYSPSTRLLQVKWKKVKGADGFMVYSLQKGKYKLIKSTGNNAVVFNVIRGKQYNLKICAYKNVLGKRCFSKDTYFKYKSK